MSVNDSVTLCQGTGLTSLQRELEKSQSAVPSVSMMLEALQEQGSLTPRTQGARSAVPEKAKTKGLVETVKRK